MKKRRQLKNIGSAQKTRQRAMCDRQSKEFEILELKSKLKSKDDELEKEKEIRLSAEKHKQALEEFWAANVTFWSEKLKLVNEKSVAIVWEIQNMQSSSEVQNFKNCGISFSNDLGHIIHEMKKSASESNRISISRVPNSEEPLDLSLKK